MGVKVFSVFSARRGNRPLRPSYPGWRRTVRLRRLLAFALVAVAAVIWAWQVVQPQPQVAVIIKDVPAGQLLSDDAISIRPQTTTAPPGVFRAVPHGRITAAHLVPGDVVSESKLVPQEYTAAHAGEDLLAVPVDNPHALSVLSPGDTVTLVQRRTSDTPQPAVAQMNSSVTLATGALVIAPLLPQATHSGITGNSPDASHTGAVLLSLPTAQARAVAAAQLSGPIAIVISGHSGIG